MTAVFREAGSNTTHSRRSLTRRSIQATVHFISIKGSITHTLRRLRPLARRLFRTALPDFVDIRSKNP